MGLGLPVDIAVVKAEWVGYCKTRERSGDAMSEKEKYNNLQKDVSSDVLLFHVHGGAF